MTNDWSKVEDLFGRVRDTEIARKMGVTKEAVRQQRERRGIPPFKQETALPEGAAQLLGQLEDEEIAKRFGVPKTRVTLARRKANIALPVKDAPIRTALKAIDWATDTRTDAEIAECLNTTTGTVCRIRNELDIPHSYARGRKVQRGKLDVNEPLEFEGVDITPFLCVMSSMRNAAIAEHTGLSPVEVGRLKNSLGVRQYRKSKHNPDWLHVVPRLGTVRDAHLAKELGIPATLLYGMRNRLNVPAFSETEPSLPERILLAEGDDEESIAREYSVSRSYVRLVRKFGKIEQEAQ